MNTAQSIRSGYETSGGLSFGVEAPVSSDIRGSAPATEAQP